MGAYEHIGLRRFIDRAVERNLERTFLHFRGREWSYAELGAITDGAACALQSLGLRRGDRVAMLLPNGPDHVFAWLALSKLGAIAAPIHTDLAAEEMAAVLERLQPAAIVWHAALREKLALARARIDRVAVRIEAGDRSDGARGPAPTARLSDLLANRRALHGAGEARPEDLAEILTTSGTTGVPKAVMQTQRTSVITGEAFAHWLDLRSDDRLFTCLPLAHINARSYSTMGALAAGASLALEERFSASRFWIWMSATRATQFNAIGAMLKMLLDRPAQAEERAHRLRLAYGAPALGPEAHLDVERRFGLRLVIGYGLTESTFGFIHPLEGERDLASMGRPRRHPHDDHICEVRLVAADPGASAGGEPGSVAQELREAQPGEIGEVWLRNPAMFAGYLGDEEATRDALAGGWLRTGDLARRDERGWYFFAGRKKHVIRRRGENLTPGEVEAVLEKHPAVLEAAVIGVPSPLGEEDVRALVVLREGASLTFDELAAFCRARLAAFKVPSQWRAIDRLPRTATQRVAYHLLPRD